jgi:hypothetical protein
LSNSIFPRSQSFCRSAVSKHHNTIQITQ